MSLERLNLLNGGGGSSRFSYEANNNRQRPLSADNQPPDFKGSFSKRRHQQAKQKRPYSSASSSNILKLLLSENINRSGLLDEKSMDRDGETSDDDDDDEIKEDIASSVGDEEEEVNNYPLLTKKNEKSKASVHFGEFSLNPGVTKKPPIKQSLESKSLDSKPFPKPNLNAWLEAKNNLPNKSETKPDLPGRVSFSSNDIFEIDYSDYSDDSNHSASVVDRGITKKYVRFEVAKANPPESLKEVTEEEEEPTMDYRNLTFAPADSSSKIIEEYKREILDLNRKHEEEMNKLGNGVLFFNENNLVTEDSVDSSKNPVIENYFEVIKEDLEEDFEIQDNDENIPYSKDIELQTDSPKPVSLKVSDTCTWDNGQKSDLKQSESSEEIEDEEEKPPPVSTKDKKKVPQKPLKTPLKDPQRKPKTTGKFPQTPDTAKKPKRPLSKSKEESTLGEFQMDKVDSWMSREREREREKEKDEMRTLMLMKRHQHSSSEYSKDWRDTPSSKTDDEGNFSLEEANDCFSNESTTYDEMVSIIKEIEADKRKTNQFKDLQSDVEFKLKSELAEEDGNDTPEPTSDPVK